MPDNLTSAVARAAKRWRGIQNEQAAAWTAIEALPPEEARAVAVGLVLAVGAEALGLRQEMWRRFKVAVTFVLQADKAQHRVNLPPGGLRLSRDEAPAYSYLLGQAICDQHVLWRVGRATDAGWDTREALRAAREALTEGPVVLAGLAQLRGGLAPLPEQREAASYVAAGWADTQIRMFGRLREALWDTSKQQELLSATCLAWGERQPDEPLAGKRSTVRRITRLLSRLGVPPQEVLVPDVAAAAQFHAQEEAREHLRRLAEQVSLSGREAQVLNLHLMEHTHGEIARALGIAEGSVKSLWSRTMKKLRAAARSE